MVLRICNCFNSGIIVVESYLYELLFYGRQLEGTQRLQMSCAAIMPYNYTLRHTVKCYTNNNINREQLQSQCKLWRRRYRKFASEPKISNIPKREKKQIQHENQFIDTKENKRTKISYKHSLQR